MISVIPLITLKGTFPTFMNMLIILIDKNMSLVAPMLFQNMLEILIKF